MTSPESNDSMHDWQTYAALAVVAMAIVGLIRLAITTLSSAGGCGTCHGCAKENQSTPLVHIKLSQRDD
jgi:hypothetical protein